MTAMGIAEAALTLGRQRARALLAQQAMRVEENAMIDAIVESVQPCVEALSAPMLKGRGVVVSTLKGSVTLFADGRWEYDGDPDPEELAYVLRGLIERHLQGNASKRTLEMEARAIWLRQCAAVMRALRIR